MTFKIVLLRHGESVWNEENLFTGWVDVNLSEKGVCEAAEAGKLLKQESLSFDVVFSSVLTRAIKTANIALENCDMSWLPMIKDWRLNERMYGDLQGLNKKETVEKFGEDQVHIWRRSYDIPPPKMDETNEYYPGNDRRYSSLSEDQIPLSECLKDTVERFLPLWNETIAPRVKSGENILIVAHGNSLRALVMHLDGISESDIPSLNIPTGIPLVYELDADLKPIKSSRSQGLLSGYYLGDPEAAAAAASAVAAQSSTK